MSRGVCHHLTQCQRGIDVVLPGGTNLGKMLRSGEDLPLGAGHVLLPSCNHEDGLLPPHWGLDVRVGLRSKSFDLTT